MKIGDLGFENYCQFPDAEIDEVFPKKEGFISKRP